MNFSDFKDKCITCLKANIIEENWEKKVQCDKWWSFWWLNDWCSVDYIKDITAFDTKRFHELIWDNFVLEEDFK